MASARTNSDQSFFGAVMASAMTNSDPCVFQAVCDGIEDDLFELESIMKLAESHKEMGETPLLVAIGKKHFFGVKFLVGIENVDIGQTGRFVLDGVNYADCPPLFAAIISDQDAIVGYLIRRKHGKPLLDLDSFLSSSMTCRQKTYVLELIGATYLLTDHDLDLHVKGLSYWENAMALKSSTADVRHPQIPHHSSTPDFLLSTGSTSEMVILERLKLMINNQSVPDRRLVKEQALRVSQQVLSEMQLFPNMFFISHFFKYMRALLPGPIELQRKTKDELEHLSNLAMRNLQLMKLWWEKQNPSSSIDGQGWRLNQAVISLYSYLSGSMKIIWPDYVLPFSDMMFTLEFACQNLHRMYTKFWSVTENQPATCIGRMTQKVRNISAAMFRSLPQFSQQECQQFKQCLSHCVRLYRGSDETDRPHLLHEVCCPQYVTSQKEADYDKFVQLWLEFGEDPNATDSQGNTPLHCLLAKNYYEYALTDPWDDRNGAERISIVSLNYVAVIRLLLDSGCHIDQPNVGGETILDLLKRNRKMQGNFKKPFDPYLQSVINSVLPLTCHCAQFIRKHNISVEELPVTLQLFVRRHGSIRRTTSGSRLVFNSTSR